MEKLNLLIKNIDSRLADKKPFILKRCKIILSLFLIFIITFFSVFFLCIKIFDGVGISGTYVCYLSNNDKTSIMFLKLVVHQDNKCVLYNFFDDTKILNEPVSREYYWAIRYERKVPEYSDNRIPRSSFQFSFENDNGNSFFQYSYFPNSKKFILHNYNDLFNNGIVELTKNE